MQELILYLTIILWNHAVSQRVVAVLRTVILYSTIASRIIKLSISLTKTILALVMIVFIHESNQASFQDQWNTLTIPCLLKMIWVEPYHLPLATSQGTTGRYVCCVLVYVYN